MHGRLGLSVAALALVLAAGAMAWLDLRHLLGVFAPARRAAALAHAALPPELPREAFRAAAESARPALRRCYEAGMKMDPDLGGQIVALLTIESRNGKGR